MRLHGPSGVRDFPLDRNPTTTHTGNEQAEVGGTVAVRATYTVPVGRRALVCQAWLSGVVTTVLAAGQSATLRIDGGPTAQAKAGVAWQAAAAVGTRDQCRADQFYLDAGDVISCRVNVTAGAGVLYVFAGLTVLEFDV